MSAQDNIYNLLKAAPAFHPGSVELFDDITLEPGDIVTIRSGQTDQTLPIYNQHITWTGSVMTTLESTGNEKRSALPPLQKKQKNTSFSGGRTSYTQGKQFASFYGAVKELEKDVQTISGSVLWQNESNLVNIVGTVTVDNKNNRVIINDGYGLYTNDNGTYHGVWDEGNLTAGVMIKKINGDETEVALKADKLYLDADKTVKVGEALFITTGGAFWVKRNATFGNKAGEFVTINGGTVNAPTLQVNSGGSLQFSPGSQSGSAISINHATAASLITDVQISGPVNDVYTLQYKKIGTGGTWNNASVTFSRATTLYKSNYKISDTSKTAGWSSGRFTVRAEPQNVETSTRLAGIAQSGDITKSSIPKYVNFPFKINYVDDDENELDTGFRGVNSAIATVSVDASVIYDDGWDAAVNVASIPTQLANSDTIQATMEASWPNKKTSGSSTTRGTTTNIYTLRVTKNDAYISIDSGEGNTKDFAHVQHNQYNNGQNSVVSTFTKATSLPTGINPTNFEESSLWRYHVTKDGADVVDTYYKVPAAIVSKVSASGWTSGVNTFTAGTSGESSIPVSLSVVPSTNWSNASVPANPTFRIDDGQSPTGLTGTFRLQVNNDYVYVKSDTNNPVVGTNVLARQTNTAYAAGKQAVTVKSVVRVENCDYDDDQGTAYDDVTVTLWDGTTVTKTLTIQDVDFSDAYQAGLNGQQAPAYLDFEIPLEDENGTVIDTYDWRCTNLSDIYQQGVDDATPVTPKYYITTDGDPIIMWKASPSGDYSNFCGWLYPRTEVTVLGTTDYFYQISYGGVTGYISQSRVEYTTSPTSPTNYPGKTGWSTFAENGYTYSAKTNTANVNLREGPGTSYPIILKMPTDAQLYCMYDPADLPPDNQWNDAVYRKATHDLYLGCVDCSFINIEDTTITVTVNWLRHSSGDYGSSIPTFMLPNGAETSITSNPVSDTSYVNTPVSSGVNINDFFNPTKTGFFGRYELAAVALTEMYHKVNFTVSYSDGSPSQTYTCEFKSYKKTSSAEFDVGQTVYVYASNGGSVIVRTVPSVPSGTYGNLTPHTPVTIVSGPDNGYYQIRYAQTGYNTVTGYINADYLRSSVQGSSNYNYTGWVKSEPVEPTVTSRTISIVEVIHNRSVTTTTPISTRFTLKSPYTTSGGGSLLVASSQARVVDVYNNHGSGYTRLSSLTAYFSQVTHSSSTYNYTLEHSVIFTVTTKYSDNTSTSTTYVGKISSNKT